MATISVQIAWRNYVLLEEKGGGEIHSFNFATVPPKAFVHYELPYADTYILSRYIECERLGICDQTMRQQSSEQTMLGYVRHQNRLL